MYKTSNNTFKKKKKSTHWNMSPTYSKTLVKVQNKTYQNQYDIGTEMIKQINRKENRVSKHTYEYIRAVPGTE